MHIKFGKLFVIAALGLYAAGAAIALICLLWPLRTVEVKGHDDILNPNRTVQAGQALIYKISYCKYTNKQAVITRTLRGAKTSYPLPPSTNNIPQGCATAISKNTIIPEGVEPGVYKLELTAEYKLNPIRTEHVEHESVPFTVTAR